MRISDWSSDVCSSDLENVDVSAQPFFALILAAEPGRQFTILIQRQEHRSWTAVMQDINRPVRASVLPDREVPHDFRGGHRSEEHTSELQSLMRISYAVFCLKKTK